MAQENKKMEQKKGNMGMNEDDVANKSKGGMDANRSNASDSDVEDMKMANDRTGSGKRDIDEENSAMTGKMSRDIDPLGPDPLDSDGMKSAEKQEDGMKSERKRKEMGT